MEHTGSVLRTLNWCILLFINYFMIYQLAGITLLS
jgi:hypothetical protein